MTDRVKGFVVTLDKDIRIDDVQPLIDAIGCMKCVINVQPVISGSDPDGFMTELRVRQDLREKLLELAKSI